MNHSICSNVKLIIANPCGNGLVELRKQTGLWFLCTSSAEKTQYMFGGFFKIPNDIFVFTSVFFSILGECVFWVPEVIMMAC